MYGLFLSYFYVYIMNINIVIAFLINRRTRLFENLRMLPHAPGVQVQAIPEDGAIIEDTEIEEKMNLDERLSQRDLDKRIQRENEYSDSEDEGEGGRRDNRLYKVIIFFTNLYLYLYLITSFKKIRRQMLSVLTFLYVVKGSTKRLRLEKNQEMDIRIMNALKKEDDIKELKGIKLISNYIFTN